jgi:predicted transcriptional regulator
MRRIQVVIDPKLDDRLEEVAAARRMSKSALVRECVERSIPDGEDNGLRWLGELSAEFADVAATDIDTELYGPLETDS